MPIILRNILFFMAIIGQSFIEFIQLTGSFFLFIAQIFVVIFTTRFSKANFFKHFIEIFFYSLPVIGLTAVFTGAVLALQSYASFSRIINAESAIGSIVVLSITRELGPVLGGLMLAGRVSSSIAAEISTMRVTEQIDALCTLRTNPINYLISHRIIAGIIALPILVLIADIIGVFGGYLIAVNKLDFNEVIYLNNTFQYLKFTDVSLGLIKAAAFGFIVSTIGSYCGYKSSNGAKGVGQAATHAVVSSSILILVFNYIITGMMFDR